VITHPRDTTKFRVVTEHGNTYFLSTKSRTARDLQVLTIRVFHAMKFIPASQALSKLFSESRLSTDSDGQSTLHQALILGRLVGELQKALSAKEIVEKQLKQVRQERKSLDEQLLDTIASYKETIEVLHQQQQSSGGSADYDPVLAGALQAKLTEEEQRKANLQEELAQAKRSLLEARQRSRHHSSLHASESVEHLTAENNRLKTMIADREAALAQLQDAAAVPRAGQMTRSIQELRQEKRTLEDELSTLESRVRQAEASNEGAAAGIQRELQAVNLERSTLARRVEELSRELEKGKSHQEGNIERVTAANGRLMEDKERLERQLRQVSSLYQETVQQLNAGQQRPAGAAPAVTQVAGLQAQITQMDDAIRRTEAENEALKSHIRRLAAR